MKWLKKVLIYNLFLTMLLTISLQNDLQAETIRSGYIKNLPTSVKSIENGGFLTTAQAHTDGIGVIIVDEALDNSAYNTLANKYAAGADKLLEHILLTPNVSAADKELALLLLAETPNGVTCDDGNAATINDIYTNGVCYGKIVTTPSCTNSYIWNDTLLKCTGQIDFTYGATEHLSYQCSDGVLSGKNCDINADYSATSAISYSCPSGGTLSGTTCLKNTTSSYAATGNISYSCPSGGTLSGVLCLKNTTSTYTATGTTTYSCPTGGTLSGTTCLKMVSSSYAATAGTAVYSCPSGGNLFGTMCFFNYQASLISGVLSCPLGGSLSVAICYKNYAAISVIPYSCPSGGTLSGTTCTVTTSANYIATGTNNYSCPSGGTLSGSTCTATVVADYKAISAINYFCPSGGALSGSTCTQIVSANYAATGATNYSCPLGGVLSGTVCAKKISVAAVEERTYSCPEGILFGMNCTKQIADYNLGTCEANYTFVGNRCIQN